MSLVRWLGISSLLAVAGVLGVVILVTGIALAGGGTGPVRETQIAVVVWAQAVLAKALLPHVWITILAYRAIEAGLGRSEPSVSRLALGVLGVAAATSVGVVTLLLTADLPGLPSVSLRGAAKVARTSLELTAATSLAVTGARLWAHRRRRSRSAGAPAATTGPGPAS